MDGSTGTFAEEREPLRILHVFSTFDLGGPQRRAVDLAARMGRTAEHHVVAMDGKVGARAQWPREVSIEMVPPPGGGPIGRIRAMREVLRAVRPDLVMTYNWGAIEWLAACRTLGILDRLVHHEDGFGVVERVRPLWRRSMTRRALLRGVPAVVVPSRTLERIAREQWRVRPDRLHLLPNGVDLERFAPSVGRARGRASDTVFGTVGGLRAVKDHETAIRAFAAARCAGRARLRIVGEGDEREGLEGLAADLGLAERVRFVGAVRDSAPEYGEMDVFFLSSRSEQMPIALLEAMASALPVISTDVGDVREVLSPENASAQGLLVRPGDVGALAAAFDRLAHADAVRLDLGAANRARVERRYPASSCLDRFLAVYRQVADRSRAARRGSGR